MSCYTHTVTNPFAMHVDIPRMTMTFKLRIRMGKKDDLSNFECGVVIFVRWADLIISE